MGVRRPDFAGSWYPDTERGCRAVFEEFEQESTDLDETPGLVAGIVPHAGWMFSGRIAYDVIRALARHGEADTVVLFGGHLRPSAPITVMDSGDFWTPMGLIPTDEELASAICSGETRVTRESPERHAPDNTIELQAPIIRHLLPEARILVIGAPPREETLKLAADLVAHAQRLSRRLAVIGSTDLTHYGPNYGWAPRGLGAEALRWVREESDPRWIELACKLDAAGMIQEALDHHNACCPGAAAAAAQAARSLGHETGRLLSYATSADVRPDASFVGYAGIVF